MIRASMFYLPSVGTRAEVERGMAGASNELYQRMLSDLRDQTQLGDQLGYESVAFTEHHFHIEGFELSNNPVLLDAFVGLQTKRIKVGQLGIVLPASNPIRVAEDIAMLDHMTGGRAVAGFARGYQRRWVDVMGQQNYGVHGVKPGEHDEVDRVNREAFEESFKIIKLAWTKETFSYQGKYWKIPPEQTPWTLDATRQWGKGVENGIVREIGVVPKPLQKPYPALFQPFASSERTIRWCARENVTPVLPQMREDLQRQLFDIMVEESAAAGHPLKFGEQMGLLRDVIIADSDAEARRLWNDSGAFIGASWFAPFGFAEVLKDPKTGEAPDTDSLFKRGLALVGTVDTVSRQLEALIKHAPNPHIFAWMYVSAVPNATMMRSIELFATKVMPRFA
jgi:alkanesulfonate monooxygenase SsuD/methylene tetrahydromethanopterin reductase-like flavin-dependent oxidoreductase (luciferase family)